MKLLNLTSLSFVLIFSVFASASNSFAEKTQTQSSTVIAPSSFNEEDVVSVQLPSGVNVWLIVKDVLKEKQIGISNFILDDNKLFSEFIVWQSFGIQNRGQLLFIYNSPILSISMINRQSFSTSGWTSSVGSLSKKNRDLYLQSTADRILELSNKKSFAIQEQSRPSISSKPLYDSTYYISGLNYLLKSEFDSAILALNKAIEIDPKNPQLFINRGYCYMMKMIGQIDLLKRKYGYGGDGVIIDPINDKVSMYYSKANEDFETASFIDPNNSSAYYYIGLAMFNVHWESSVNQHNASVAFYKAIELNPENALSYYYLGLSTGNIEENNRKCIMYSKDSTLTSTCYEEIGMEKMKDKLYREAIAEFDNSILFNKDNGNSYLQRGISNSQLRNYNEAINDFTWLINKDPNYSTSYVLRGKAKMNKTGSLSEACPDFKKAIELGDNSAAAKENYQLCK